MLPNAATLGALRTRSYLLQLPLFTRAVIFLILIFWLLTLLPAWDIREWGSLIPLRLGFTSAYRLNTYPIIHLNFIHAVMNVLALTPLMERFESEHGTLASLALFLGPLTTIPGLLYVLIERLAFLGNTAVMGSSTWVFLLLGMEAIRTYKANPYLVVGTHHVPTWITPLALALFVSALVPYASLLGHLCGVGVGYMLGLGYLKVLSPPEKALRWLENRFHFLARLPHYISVDQKTFGRFGVLPTAASSSDTTHV